MPIMIAAHGGSSSVPTTEPVAPVLPELDPLPDVPVVVVVGDVLVVVVVVPLSTHVSRSAAGSNPSSHCVQVPSVPAVPVGQASHSSALAAACVPLPHSEQLLLPSAAITFGGQSWHSPLCGIKTSRSKDPDVEVKPAQATFAHSAGRAAAKESVDTAETRGSQAKSQQTCRFSSSVALASPMKSTCAVLPLIALRTARPTSRPTSQAGIDGVSLPLNTSSVGHSPPSLLIMMSPAAPACAATSAF
mmetsp:Transcript_37348/g.68322  ORF Transcript_37348/g.68322 Transcript_37348/m.68322 type:complete len:246 (-) Transcript_37348:832-1569(-)